MKNFREKKEQANRIGLDKKHKFYKMCKKAQNT